MKFIYTLILAFILGHSHEAFAQRRIKQMDPQKEEQEKEAKKSEHKSWKDRMTYGGNFWLSLSNTYSQIYIQPLVGYKVTDNFIAGGGFTYIYWRQSYSYYTPGSITTQTITHSDNVYGLNLFARHTLFGPVFAHTEYQPMNFTSYNGYNESRREWTHAFYVGGGVNQSGMYVQVLYDLLWQATPSDPRSFARSFYPSPWNIRIGFLF